ncbi:MAG: hypothetical protein KDD38_01320, partial [Bdellovibrionales bacterium]|nr:hypothetical protein [Bdellovibrionales bacterium]
MGINRNTNIYFILLFALLMPLGQFAHAKSPCVELISKSSHLYPFPKLSNVKLHLKFGFESEYTIDKFSHKLLGFYYPDPSLGISKQEWRALGEYSAGARVEWLTANLTQVFAHKKEPG